MARAFSLAGLLRLRQIQQDQAAGDLALANRRYRETGARERQARAALGSTSADVVDTTVLAAIAASRAASRGMLAELEAMQCVHRDGIAAAAETFAAARARSVGLEKLEGRHIEAVVDGELMSEQAALDEIGANSWQRAAEGRAQ
jgi:flagellar FliJ protein